MHRITTTDIMLCILALVLLIAGLNILANSLEVRPAGDFERANRIAALEGAEDDR